MQDTIKPPYSVPAPPCVWAQQPATQAARACLYVVLMLLLWVVNPTKALAGGWLDAAQEGRYRGWACMPGSSLPVGIHIWRSDGVFLGGGNASMPRELAVQRACGSTHSNHGFDIQISLPDRLRDGQVYKVRVYAMFANGTAQELGGSPQSVAFSLAPLAIPAPTEQATLVGRDLDMSPQGLAKTFGHIGLWDGTMVLEMLNEGGPNKAKRNSWQNFSSRTKVWPSINPSIPRFDSDSCFSSSSCSDKQYRRIYPFLLDYQTVLGRKAIVLRAQQIIDIGSDYTVTTTVRMALPSRIEMSTSHCNPFSTGVCEPVKRVIAGQRGSYRCDTFVIEAFASSVLPERHPYQMVEATPLWWNVQGLEDWKKKMRALVYNTTYLPSSVHTRLKEFQ